MESNTIKPNLLYFDVSKLPEDSHKKAKISINKKINDGQYAEVAVWCMNQFYSTRTPVMATMGCFYLKKSGKFLVLENFIRFIDGFDPSIITGFPSGIKSFAEKILGNSSVDLTESRESRQSFREEHRWPRDITMKSQDKLVRVFESLYEKFNKNKTISVNEKPKFVTIGSCFAVNISRSLKRLGYECFNVQIDERKNSTDRISRIFSEYGGDYSGLINPSDHDINIKSVRSKIDDASHIIVTLGVSLVFRENNQEKPNTDENIRNIISGKLKPYILSHRENFLYMENIIKSINTDKTQIILSISPVPLTWANCSVGDLICYDMQSKISLVEAAHSICRDYNVVYWPSFEFIKWFGSHSSDPFFGADHPDSRHVRDEVVDLVTESFISKLS